MVEVVNMRNCDPAWGQPGDMKIDRTTKFGNPYPLRMDTPLNRTYVISKYEVWIDTQIAFGLLDISELYSAKRLGCWCKPKLCHGDIIKKKIEAALKSDQKTMAV